MRDLKNFYHGLKVSDPTTVDQALGPRVPAAWFIDLWDEACDELFCVDPWWIGDMLGPGSGPAPLTYVQPACCSLVMGCHRAVGGLVKKKTKKIVFL